ncbi:MAG: HAMP domain-containing sensor histidine kinase, partial [Gammaproteobacteria bacterium]|nr:HAMP domain-containing sensor histidine kinase [Gammaproteobacteria bacterium]
MLRATLARGFDRSSLRTVLLLFFLALGIPTAILIYQAFDQLKWEAFHQHRLMAEELALRIDNRLVELIESEESHSFADYSFLVVAGDPEANFLQRSPLSSYPVDAPIPGLLAYFQVDARGGFSTPLLPRQSPDPRSYGIPAAEYAQRLALQQQLQQVLSRNRLVLARPDEQTTERRNASAKVSFDDRLVVAEAAEAMEAPADSDSEGQAAFDRLNESYANRNLGGNEQEVARLYGRVEDLLLDSSLAAQSRELARGRRQASAMEKPGGGQRSKRKELISVPEPTLQKKDMDKGEADVLSSVRVMTFESEIDPFDFALLDSGHFVLFRKVWRDGQRYIQGAVIEQQAFVQGLIANSFRSTGLAGMSDLIIAYRGNVVAAVRGQSGRNYLESSRELSGALLYRTRLSAPLADLELVFSITRLPTGPGGPLLGWISLILMLVLCGGVYLMYRLGLSQLELTRKQQDFVSAVSHELKTPLTSIRMYGEMLRAGWADEDKKQSYYEFIYQESERLSRLITNVLQLARLTRSDPQFDLKPVDLAELIDMVASKIASQIQGAGFVLEIDNGSIPGQTAVLVDTDSFTQVFINLVDNAIKFSAGAEKKLIELGARVTKDGTVL